MRTLVKRGRQLADWVILERKMYTILTVEDDLHINNLLKEALGKAGYACSQAFSGTEALLWLEHNECQLILLDLMLPGLSGEEVLQQIRQTSNVPVIVLTAKGEMEEKLDLLSANEYMENVTSFSASLLSACAGDTNKSAEIANKAMIDMADNANKMGTDMGSIQNAYQGFAKQNYTMLDNLKLGYGGTKEEMDRLLKDAQAITGTKYDINNLADVYTAIGVIQDKLNITGTTAREAEQTFSGSFAMMKASVTNLLGNLSIGDGEAVARSMGELVESASTFFFGNFIPMLQTIFSNLPTAIGTAVEKVAPQIKENVLPLLTSIKDAIFTGLGNIGIDTGALQAIFDQLFNVKVDGGGIASMFSGLKDGIVQAINTILPIIPPIISAVQQIAPVVGQVISTIMGGVSQIIPYIVPVIQTITNIIVTAMPVIQQIITVVVGAIVAIMPTLSSIFTFVGNVIQQVLTVIGNHMGLFQTIVSVAVTVKAGEPEKEIARWGKLER